MGKYIVEQMFIMPDGSVKREAELTNEEKTNFAQRMLDALTPMLYESVMRDIRREREAGV